MTLGPISFVVFIPSSAGNSPNFLSIPKIHYKSPNSDPIYHLDSFQFVRFACFIDLNHSAIHRIIGFRSKVDFVSGFDQSTQMVCFHSSIPVSQHMNMANQSQKSPKRTPISTCEQSPSAWIDLIILIAVIGACGFLIYPYANLICFQSYEFLEAVFFIVKDEVLEAPMIYGCLALSIFSASMAVLAITICTSQKCGKPGCRGLHKAAEFDIQLETGNKLINSSLSNGLGKIGLKKGLFELPRDYHKELEAELKKMAPINGRAVLVFRARCGCSVGRMEVPGPKLRRTTKRSKSK